MNFRNKRLYFFRNFLKDRFIAALFPTFLSAVQKICKQISFEKDINLIEFGPGTGIFTKYILQNMGPHSRLIVIESNKEFVLELKKIKDSRLFIYHGFAQDVDTYCVEQKIENVDYIISGIPLSFFESTMRTDILIKSKKILKSGGRIILYQYSPLMKKYLRKVFSNVSMKMNFRNFPPLFVITSVKV